MVVEQFFQLRFVGLTTMPDAFVQIRFLLGTGQHFFQRHHRGVAAFRKQAVFVVHVSDTAAHTRRKVASGFTQNRHRTARHVFATVVARTFNNGSRARKTHGKTLACHAAEERFARSCAVHHGITDDGVLGRFATEIDAGAHHDTTAG